MRQYQMALWIKVIYHCLVEVLVERDSTSTHVNGFSFLPAKTVSFDKTKANNRWPYNLSVL